MIKKAANGQSVSYFTYSCETNSLSSTPKVINPYKIIIVEGVSSSNPKLLNLYFKKIWVASDINSEIEALLLREGDKNIELWKNLYFPSVDIYYNTKPWFNADIIYAGRGIKSKTYH